MGNCGQNDCNLLTRKKLLKVNQLGKYFGMNQITVQFCFKFTHKEHFKDQTVQLTARISIVLSTGTVLKWNETLYDTKMC